jgi:hypothetical protein
VNRRAAAVVVGLAAVATIVITAATSGGSSTRLPLPITVSAAKAAPIHHRTATDGGGIDGGTSSGQGQTYTTTPPVPLTACTVSVSNPSPPRGLTAEKVTVQTAPGAHVSLTALYNVPRIIRHGALADSGGRITFDLSSNHAQGGFTVVVTATASLRGVQKSCSTSFTPVLF